MHRPVLKDELINALDIKPNGFYVDCTGGGGGHASAVLERLGGGGRLLVLDRDPEAVSRLQGIFAGDGRVSIVHANFKDVAEILKADGYPKADGLYADFGISSWQIGVAERGFSFMKDGVLDMRMNNTIGESAQDVVNRYSEEQLSEIIYRYGEERFSRRIAEAIVKRRNIKPFEGTVDLANVVKCAVPAKFHKHGFHPATQTFQALRIHVNQELVAVETLLRTIEEPMNAGGKVAFISFHSLEDRIVKEYLNRYEKPCTCPPEFPICICGKVQSFKVITKKPIQAGEIEIKANPLSRSAKMRVAERVGL